MEGIFGREEITRHKHVPIYSINVGYGHKQCLNILT